jgi:PIN domain nuclease of toxin-antitoxin system
VNQFNRRRRGFVFDHTVAWFERSAQGLREAPLTHEIALWAERVPLHSDPADRFLAATAKVPDLTLVTADRRLLGWGDIATLANR